MLDTDRWLEDRLRVALREEAEALPFTLTFADLERRLAERRTMRRRVAGVPAWWAAAALLLLAGAAVVGAVLLTEDRTAPPPPPAPTTIPSAVVPVNLPSTAELLVDVPGAIVRLEHRYDPAVDAASPAPGGRFELGSAAVGGAFVEAVACVGGESVTIEIGELQGGPFYSSTPVPCDGRPHVTPSTRTDAGPLGVVLTADASTAWAVTVADLGATQAEAPVFDPVVLTAGWTKVVDLDPSLATASQGAGISVAIPPAATRLAVWITCRGDAPATATFGDASADLDCSTDMPTRLETPATGSEPIDARVESEGLVWVAITVESDMPLDVAYPSAPDLPPDVAAATWAAFGGDYLTMGTVGGAPRLVAMPTHQSRAARDGLVAIAVSTDEPPSGTIHLVSIPDGEIVGTPVDTDGYVGPPWLDTTHDQVVYGKRAPTAFEFRRVGVDGSGDELLVSIPLGPHPDGALATFSGEIALDDSVYVLDVCRESGACERSIVDLATLATTTSDVSDRPLCSIVGVIDDLVVGYRDASCTGGTFDPDTPPVLAVQPLDGGEERIFDDVPLSGGGQLVQTAHGPVLVATTMPGDDISHRVLAVSLIDGSVTTLLERGADARSFMTPLPVRLPPGYVLIGTSLADEPAQRNFLVRDVPILVDLDSGEQTPLPNLPHSIDPAP